MQPASLTNKTGKGHSSGTGTEGRAQIVPFVRVRGVSQSVSEWGRQAGRGLAISKIPFSIQRMAIVSEPPLLLPSFHFHSLVRPSLPLTLFSQVSRVGPSLPCIEGSIRDLEKAHEIVYLLWIIIRYTS